MPASEAISVGASGIEGPAPAHGARVSLGLALAHALLFLVAFPPIGLWPCALLAVAPLAWLAIGARSTRRVLLLTASVHVPLWLWLQRWLIQVTPVGYALLPVYMTFYPLLFVWIIRRISRHHMLGAWPMTLVVPVVWVGLECVRGEIVFGGYPWFLMGQPLIEWAPLAQSADVLGTYLVSFLAVVVCGFLTDLGRACDGARGVRSLAAPAVLVLALHGGNIVYGLWRVGQAPAEGPAVRVLVIQTNLPQDNKIGWPREAQERDVPRFIDLTVESFQQAAREGPVDLIVWPETMVPGVGMEPDVLDSVQRFGPDNRYLYKWGERVAALSAELGVPMLVGSGAWVGTKLVRADAEDGTPMVRLDVEARFNSAYLVQGDPPYQRSDKHFLTPFGETMPYVSAWPWLEEKLLALGARGMTFNLDQSDAVTLLRLARGDEMLTLATPICFEDTVARVCRSMVYRDGRKQADILVNLSNDGWFGWDDGGRQQHAQVARFRCIENRVPMVRAVNTGLSISIDSNGIVDRALGAGRYGLGRRAGALVADVRLDGRTSCFGRVGNAGAWICLAATLILGLGTFFSRKGKTP